MKSKARRIPYTIHLEEGTVAAIDTYVGEHGRDERKSYSLSDFLNEAAEDLLQKLKRMSEEAENTESNALTK